MIFVWPITAMKLASPPQRGTTCWCRWAASEPPATAPRFIPTLNACGSATVRMARSAFCVNTISSADSASVSSSSSATCR